MNAVPLKPGQSPADILETLIAKHGTRAVVLALAAKLIKRTRPPDIMADPLHTDQPEFAHLSDHMRADIGLPPKDRPSNHVLTALAMQRDTFHF